MTERRCGKPLIESTASTVWGVLPTDHELKRGGVMYRNLSAPKVVWRSDIR